MSMDLNEKVIKQYSWFAFFSILAIIYAIISTSAGIGILILLAICFVWSWIFLKEKTLLIFLILRPIMDYWRDLPLVEIARFKINLNSALALVMICWLGIILFKYKQKIIRAPLFWPLLLFSVLLFASTVYSFYPSQTLIEAVKFVDIGLVFLGSYVLAKSGIIKEKEFIVAFYIAAVIPLLMGVYQFISGSGLTTFNIQGRVFGTFAHPNVFAFFLLIILMVHCLYSTLKPMLFWQNEPFLKYAIYIASLALLLFTYTRAAWIGLAIFIIIIGILKYRKALIITLVSVSMLLGGLLAVNELFIQFGNINLQKNPLLSRLTTRSEEADSISWRQTLIVESIPIILQRPLLGFGYGTFPQIWEDQRSKQHFYDDSAEAHNDYLRLSLEVGFIGLAIYLFLLSRLFILAIKPVHHESDAPKHLFFFVSIIVFAVLSISDNMLHHTPVMWWIWALWGMWASDLA